MRETYRGDLLIYNFYVLVTVCQNSHRLQKVIYEKRFDNMIHVPVEIRACYYPKINQVFLLSTNATVYSLSELLSSPTTLNVASTVDTFSGVFILTNLENQLQCTAEFISSFKGFTFCLIVFKTPKNMSCSHIEQ